MNVSMLNDVEKRIIQGSFPNSKLASIAYTEGQTLSEYGEENGYYSDGVKQLLHDNFRVVGTMKMISYLEEHVLSGHKEWTDNPIQRMINVMINTECWPDDVVGEVYYEASHLCPTVTKVDKMITNAVVSLFGGFWIEGIKGKSPDEETFAPQRNLFYALLRLLHMVQDNEKNSFCTINVDKIDFSCKPIDILIEWSGKVAQLLDPSCEPEGRKDRIKNYINWVSESKYIIPLSDQECVDFKRLSEKRLEITNRIKESKRQLKAIEEATSIDWELFLRFIFDISNQEDSVIQIIIDQHATAAEKLRAIETYEEEIKKYKAGLVYINDSSEDINRIIDSVEKRLAYFPLSRVKATDGKEFCLDPTLLSIVKRYEDYNYLLIKYHHFRLTSNKVQIAEEFLKLSLSIISRNLTQNEESSCYQDMSIFELISSFYDVVSTFYSNNKHVIDSLPYSELQEPSTIGDKDTLDAISISSFLTESVDKIEEQRDKYISKVDNMLALEGEIDELTENEMVQFASSIVASMYNSMFIEILDHKEERLQQIKDETKARQIVVSLDIIYLFCDSIRMMLQEPNEFGIHERELQSIKQMNRHLLRIEKEVNNSVYAEIPWDKPDLMEMRQERGLDTKSLIEQEKHEEELRNTAFKSAFDNAIRQIFDQVARGSIVDIFNWKILAREEFSKLPNCGYKSLAVDLFDAISYEICEKLVSRDKTNNDSFDERRVHLIEGLGVESKMLPPQTIDSLTTAEYLYNKYVTQEYAEAGFDYSCISILYYQSFEEAYNALIWREYAEKLNNMELCGRDFTTLLRIKNRSDDLTFAAEPFFYTKYEDFKLFMDKNTKKFSSSCMFAPFVRIMREVTENRKLTAFRDFFAKKVGFESVEEMRRDLEFMVRCSDFVNAIENCIDYRNYASHGGLRVDAEQCEKDKKNVICNIETIRLESLGLIQQLLLLLNWKKNSNR